MLTTLKTRKRGLIGLILFGFVLLFYLATLAPSLNWADGARIQLDIMLGGSTYWYFEGATHIPTDGLPFDRLGAAAWDHPLYVMIGRLFVTLPWGEPEYRINLMSAIAGAVAIFLLYRFGLFLTDSVWGAMAGALALTVAHTFWFHAVTTEVYTLNVTFMVGLLWLTLLWSQTFAWRYLAFFALLAGLGMANHLMLGLTVLIAVIFMLAVSVVQKEGDGYSLSWERWRIMWQSRPIRPFLIIVLSFLIGFAPWWIQFLRTLQFVSLPLAIQVAIGFPWLGQRMEFQSLGSMLLNLAGYGGWLLFQFSPVGVALGLYGFVLMWRQKRAVALLLLAVFASHVLFSANYRLADQFNFHLPSYLAFTQAITWGVAGLLRKTAAWHAAARNGMSALLLAVIVILPIMMYTAVPRTLTALGITDESVGIQPIGIGVRDALSHFLVPNKRGDFTAMNFARSTLDQVASDALILTPKSSDQETYVILRYAQMIKQMRPDIYLELLLFEPGENMSENVLKLIHEQAGCRPVYVASLHPATVPLASLSQDYEIFPEANLFRVQPKPATPISASCPELRGRWQHLTAEELLRRAMRWE